MKLLTNKKQESIGNAKICYICKEKFEDKYLKKKIENKYLKDKKYREVRKSFLLYRRI